MPGMNGDMVLPFGSSRPDFVITGATTSSGVRIIASRKLVDTELNVDLPRPEIRVIDAPDYPSAMAGLFDAWRKQDEQEGRAPAIGGMSALESADGAHG